MAASPYFKVFSKENEYVASFKYAEDAAAFVSIRGTGATIRRGHRRKDILFTEGEELSAVLDRLVHCGAELSNADGRWLLECTDDKGRMRAGRSYDCIRHLCMWLDV